MESSHNRNYCHLVFSTKHRTAWIKPQYQKECWAYLAGALREMGAKVSIVGGYEDHVHLLFILPMTIRGCDLVRHLKRTSSIWMKNTFKDCEDFHWQDSYSIFGVSQSQLPKTYNYIKNQPEHHKTVSSAKELEILIAKNP